ncbi:MAG: hypothetical protein PHG27_12455 [Massilibacteroides sp.]|nr:hypothetical protein [Massilibacteroides sp.]
MLRNGSSVKLTEIPRFEYADFRDHAVTQLRLGQRIVAWFASDDDLYMILADDASGVLQPIVTLREESWQSLATAFPQAGVFERYHN